MLLTAMAQSPEDTSLEPLKARPYWEGGYPADALPYDPNTSVLVAHYKVNPTMGGICYIDRDSNRWCIYELIDTYHICTDGGYEPTSVANYLDAKEFDTRQVVAEFIRNTDPENAPPSDGLLESMCVHCRECARRAMQEERQAEAAACA
jgi:hypothetical protein